MQKLPSVRVDGSAGLGFGSMHVAPEAVKETLFSSNAAPFANWQFFNYTQIW
jgi:hypothetical protein